MGVPWSSEGSTRGGLIATLGSVSVFFSSFFVEMCDFMISMPLCSGIAVLGGPGDQVGATWAQKLRPNGPKELSGTVRKAKPGDFVRSSARYFVSVMETSQNQPEPARTSQNQPRLGSDQNSKSI